jgi:hypothetical protein
MGLSLLGTRLWEVLEEEADCAPPWCLFNAALVCSARPFCAARSDAAPSPSWGSKEVKLDTELQYCFG